MPMWDVDVTEISQQAAKVLGVTIGDDVNLRKGVDGTWICRNGRRVPLVRQPWMDDLEWKLYRMATDVHASVPPAGMSFPALCGKYVHVIQSEGVSMVVHVKRYEV